MKNKIFIVIVSLITLCSCTKDIILNEHNCKAVVYAGAWESDNSYVLTILSDKTGYFIENNIIIGFEYSDNAHCYVADNNYRKTYIYSKLKSIRGDESLLDNYIHIFTDKDSATIKPYSITKKEVGLFDLYLNRYEL